MSSSVYGGAGGFGDESGRADPSSGGPARVVDNGPVRDEVTHSVFPTLGEGRREVRFGNGRLAACIAARPDADPDDLLAQLGLQPTRPVLVLLGGADSLAGADRTDQVAVLGTALARAAARAGAIVVDGATDTGMTAAVGSAVAEQRLEVAQLGVAPAGVVTTPGDGTDSSSGRVFLEENHSHLILVDASEWGAETDLLIDVADALAPVTPVAVVVGGGEVTAREAEQAVLRRWRVFVVEGTGGTAASLAARHGAPASDTGADALGGVHRIDGAKAEEVERRLAWELTDAPELKLAWDRFARYDALAVRLRRSFEHLQASILLLGVAVTLLALLQHALRSQLTGSLGWMRAVLRWSVVALPIIISTVVAFTARLHTGKRWVLLRGAAEATKREIFRYRTRTGVYGPSGPAGSSRAPDEEFLDRIGTVDAVLMKTEVSGGAVPAYDGPLPPEEAIRADDDGLSRLGLERYLDLRVRQQRAFYRSRTKTLEAKLRMLHLLSFAAGGLGTFLAAAGFELWVGLTTVMIGAIGAHLGYLQVESTLVAYNQAIAKLDDVEARALLWQKARTTTGTFGDLVDRAEAAIDGEHGGWTQQMHESLAHLTTKDAPGTTAAGGPPAPAHGAVHGDDGKGGSG